MTKRASQKDFHFVYKTTCLITGRFYIGLHSTDTLDDGYLGSGRRLRRSVEKHGKENHTREILEMFLTRDEASEAEKAIITPELLKDEQCMNCGMGGLGATDRPATKEETRLKLSEASKRVVRTKEWYEKAVATRTKNDSYKHTDETKAKISESHTGKQLTEEHKVNISEGLKGHVVSDETRENLSKALKGNPKLSAPKKPVTAEAKANIALARMGKKHSEETKAKMRAAKFRTKLTAVSV